MIGFDDEDVGERDSAGDYAPAACRGRLKWCRAFDCHGHALACDGHSATCYQLDCFTLLQSVNTLSGMADAMPGVSDRSPLAHPEVCRHVRDHMLHRGEFAEVSLQASSADEVQDPPGHRCGFQSMPGNYFALADSRDSGFFRVVVAGAASKTIGSLSSAADSFRFTFARKETLRCCKANCVPSILDPSCWVLLWNLAATCGVRCGHFVGIWVKNGQRIALGRERWPNHFSSEIVGDFGG